jgi:hypothetical protein
MAANDKIKLVSDMGIHVLDPVIEVKCKDNRAKSINAKGLNSQQLNEQFVAASSS